MNDNEKETEKENPEQEKPDDEIIVITDKIKVIQLKLDL